MISAKPIHLTDTFKLVLALILAIAIGCGVFNQLARNGHFRKPEASITGARIQKLSFSQADLLVDIKVKNPTRLRIQLAGLDYRVKINEQPFLSGTQEHHLTLNATSESLLQLPIQIRYSDLYKTIKRIGQRDHSNYNLECGLKFQIPIVGQVRLPVRKQGELPLIRIPKIRLASFQVKRLNFRGADLVVGLTILNQNNFSLDIQRLRYHLDIEGQPLASGETQNPLKIGRNTNSLIQLPLSLKLTQLGKSLTTLLKGNHSLKYRIKGAVSARTTHKLLQSTEFSFDYADKITVIR